MTVLCYLSSFINKATGINIGCFNFCFPYQVEIIYKNKTIPIIPPLPQIKVKKKNIQESNLELSHQYVFRRLRTSDRQNVFYSFHNARGADAVFFHKLCALSTTRDLRHSQAFYCDTRQQTHSSGNSFSKTTWLCIKQKLKDEQKQEQNCVRGMAGRVILG